MECVGTKLGHSGAGGSVRELGEATMTKRMLGHVLAVAATASLLAGCSASGTAQTAQRPDRTPSTSPTSTAQEPPPSVEDACFSTNGVKARSMWFKASDGVRLYGIESGTGGTAVVLAHEGGADLCGWLSYIKTLTRAGIRAFAFDFRGYGNSDTSGTGSLALGRDLAGAVAQVRADGAKHVFLMGASMGGAAVVQNSVDIRVDGLISLSGTRLWSGYGINDPKGVRSLSAAFLYVGSRQDTRAPLKEAQSIFHSVGSRDKQIVLYPGGAHGTTLVELPPHGDRTRALILKWIETRS
jgi:alpha-beta hydrolase superfamily lysophospholipase